MIAEDPILSRAVYHQTHFINSNYPAEKKKTCSTPFSILWFPWNGGTPQIHPILTSWSQSRVTNHPFLGVPDGLRNSHIHWSIASTAATAHPRQWGTKWGSKWPAMYAARVDFWVQATGYNSVPQQLSFTKVQEKHHYLVSVSQVTGTPPNHLAY